MTPADGQRPRLVFLTGAGISAESGLSTFRDSGGLWDQYRVEDVASIEGYMRNPQLVTRFYNERRRQMYDVSPNEAHRLVAQLEEKYQVCVVTQNVDNLHERAGSTNIIHLHGELAKGTSSRTPEDTSMQVDIPQGHDMTYPDDRAADGSPMRPFIVFFGEAVPRLADAAEQVSHADILVIIGTSLNVYPAAGLIAYAPPHARIYLIDPRPAPGVSQYPQIHIIAKTATEGMRQLCNEL